MTFRKLDLFPSSAEGKPYSESLMSLTVIRHRQNPIVTTRSYAVNDSKHCSMQSFKD
jgi:hypothetical protein